HLGVQKRLQLAFGFCVGLVEQPRKLGHDSSNEMVLIGETGDAWTNCFSALRHVRPIHVRSDVGLADFLERRIETSMFCAHLQYLTKFSARKSVIDGDDETPL